MQLDPNNVGMSFDDDDDDDETRKRYVSHYVLLKE